MKWSYRLGRWFGIDVHVHLTFGLLLGWIAISTFSSTGSLLATLLSMVLIAALFAFVVMHEYGHALTARVYGIRTRHITLYPIGGVAALEGMPKSAKAQALVAVAGPAVNFVLAGGLWLLGGALGLDPFGNQEPGAAGAGILRMLITANLVLGAFNLLPALPMDGGRLLKALLLTRMGGQRATAIAAKVARVVAIAMGIFGLTQQQPMLVAIAVFVWFAAGAEERMARMQARFGNLGADGSGMPEQAEQGQPADRYNAWPTDAYRHRRDQEAGAPTVEAGPQTQKGGQGGVRFVVVQGPFGPVVRVVPNGNSSR